MEKQLNDTIEQLTEMAPNIDEIKIPELSEFNEEDTGKKIY